MNCLFSIVVPVYNVKNYLEECMASILSQTCDNYEIIVVDDGSTDGSSELCDRYKSEICHVIHKQNGGLSDARNTGILAATGEYLLFIDSDDYIAADALQNFKCVIDEFQPDIIAAKAYSVSLDGTIIPKVNYNEEIKSVLPGIKYYEHAVQVCALVACAQFGAYKRQMVLDNHLFFRKGILHEDELWTPQVYYAAKSVVAGNFFFYYHRMREGSITHQGNDYHKKQKNSLDLLQTCRELEEFAQQHDKSETHWLRNNIAMLYMSATYSARLDITAFKELDRLFPLRNAYRAKDRAKAAIYALSPKLYCSLDKMDKGAKR